MQNNTPQRRIISYTLILLGALILGGAGWFVGYNLGTKEEGGFQKTLEKTEVTELEVSIIDPLIVEGGAEPIDESWAEYYIDELETTVFHTGQEPQLERRTSTNREEYRIDFNDEMTIWASIIPREEKNSLDLRTDNSNENLVRGILNIRSYYNSQDELVYLIPLKYKVHYLAFTFEKSSDLVYTDRAFIEKYLNNLQNERIVRVNRDVVYFNESNKDFPISRGRERYYKEKDPESGGSKLSINARLKPLVKIEDWEIVKEVRESEDSIYFTIASTRTDIQNTQLYEFNVRSETLIQYRNIPNFAVIDGAIIDREFDIIMPCIDCGKPGPRIKEYGRINLDEQTITNFGAKEIKVTGHFVEGDYNSDNKIEKFDRIIVQESSEFLSGNPIESDSNNKISCININLAIELITDERQRRMDVIKQSSAENPIQVTFSEIYSENNANSFSPPNGNNQCRTNLLIRELN